MKPATRPTPALMTIVDVNQMTACCGATLPVAAATAIVKTTTAVPSLNRLSASTSVARRCGAPRLLNVETTDTGSVADTMAPDDEREGQVEAGRGKGQGDHGRGHEDAWDGQDRHPEEGPAQLGEVEPVGRLEHEPRHEDDQDELGCHVQGRRRAEGRDEQPEQDERDAVRQRRPPGHEGDRCRGGDEEHEQLDHVDRGLARVHDLARDGERCHRRREGAPGQVAVERATQPGVAV